MKNYYTILGLNKDASLSEIKKAYRRLAVKFHPDKNLDDEDGFFEKMFKDINEAYNILSDSEKKDEYDKSFFYKENQDSYQNQQDDGSTEYEQPKTEQEYQDYYNSNDEANVDEGKESVLINWLIGINVLSFFLIGINTDSFMNRTVQELINYGGLAYDTFDTGELWRLISSQFIHLDLRHLLFNMYILYSIGGSLISFIDKKRFLTIYLTTGTIAAVVSLMFGNYMVSVGASGAIFGIIGYYLSLLIQFREKKIFGDNKDLLSDEIKSISIFILINLVIGFMSTIVDNGAHIGGLISGYLIGLTYEYKDVSSSKEKTNEIEYQGIGGWLYAFMAHMIWTVTLGIYVLVVEGAGIDQAVLEELLDYAMIMDILNYKQFIMYIDLGAFVEISLSIISLFLFFMKRKIFIYFISVRFIFSIFFGCYMYFNKYEIINEIEFTILTVFAFISLIVYYLYFTKSRRALNTFIN